MAKKALAIVTRETPKQETQEENHRIWRERALTEEELFHGTDGAGRTGWFLRLTLPGLYPRRIGPYASQEDASAVHEAVLHEFELDTMTDLLNDLEDGQACVTEGVPRLTATVHGSESSR